MDEPRTRICMLELRGTSLGSENPAMFTTSSPSCSPSQKAVFRAAQAAEPESVHQEAKNRPNIDWQETIHRGILRGLRNISETPQNKGMNFLL